MTGRKLSSFAPGEVRIFIDGELLPGPTKAAFDWPEGEAPWISITTNPHDLTYLAPLAPRHPVDEVRVDVYGGESMRVHCPRCGRVETCDGRSLRERDRAFERLYRHPCREHGGIPIRIAAIVAIVVSVTALMWLDDPEPALPRCPTDRPAHVECRP